MSLYFDNNKLFDAEGHLTDEGCTPLRTARWTTSAHWRPPSI